MSKDAARRLGQIQDWLRTAKENLPAINDALVPSDRIIEASQLIDRLHRAAARLELRLPSDHRAERAA
jgi:hypothetical protein